MRFRLDDSSPPEQVRRPCRLVLTGKAGHSDILVVRCTCMAEIDGAVSPRYYNYDPLGEVAELGEALALWRGHTPHVWFRRRYRAHGRTRPPS